MMQATAKELRFHTGALLDTVTRGEEVTITFRGVPKAKLVPIEDDSAPPETEAFGMWRDRPEMADPAEYVRNLRQGRFQ
jgi:prevent-host-death family protein